MEQNISNYGRDQNVHTGAGDLHVNNIRRNFVQNFRTTDSYPDLRRLHDAVAGVGASHKSKQQIDRGKCLEGTRRGALGNIGRWRLSGDSSPICWLSGTAGAGKSAIAMTVAESCEREGLLASFFFFRSDPRRNNPDALVPTIALGLLSKFPSLQAFIDRKISRNPMILDFGLADQFRELVLQPSLRVGRSGFWLESVQEVPNLVIIDGLDECGDENTQKHILSAILSSYQQPPTTRSPLKFLICSRPEAWIQEAFDEESLSHLTHYVKLDDASQDIERYLRHEFQVIRTTPKYSRVLFPSSWPSERELGQLVWNASSQFVYAVTAVKLVKSPYTNPIEQLRTILAYDPNNRSSSSPFPELDRLYHIILSANPDRDKLLSVLAAIFIAGHFLSPSPELIEGLLHLAPGEVDLTLRAMHSVLDIQGGWDTIRSFHTSFPDYLFDRSRSRIFFIDKTAWTHFLARRWLQALSAERLERYSFCQLFEGERKSLLTRWIPFCISRARPSQGLLADLRNVELGPVLLCYGELSSDWGMIFDDLVKWLRSNVCDADIIRHFQNYSGCLHLESPHGLHHSEEDRATFDALAHVVILRLNGYYQCWESETFEVPKGLRGISRGPGSWLSMFRLTGCDCHSDADFESSRSHRRYEAACLRAVNALVSSASSHHSNRFWRTGYRMFSDLVDSSLLQHCAFGPELFAQCRILFSWAAANTSSNSFYMSTAWQVERRNKLIAWLKTCPQRYAREARGLQSQIAWTLSESRMLDQERSRLRQERLEQERSEREAQEEESLERGTLERKKLEREMQEMETRARYLEGFEWWEREWLTGLKIGGSQKDCYPVTTVKIPFK
ncbi:hypothetical protein PM082_019012 [Marasmius tenuissimus]|nr:hypothetical protein PM082_019012 [Marasmius tenuissimus]